MNNPFHIYNFIQNFDSSDDDENDEQVRPKIHKLRRETRDEDYRKLFRFSRPNVVFIADFFLPPYHETRGGALSNIRKMEIFLRYMSDPGFEVNIHNVFYDGFMVI